MRPQEIVDAVNNAGRPLDPAELARLLAVRGAARRELKRMLHDLVEQGDLVRLKGDRYGPPRKMNLETGTLLCHPDGYGFVQLQKEGQKDLFVSPRGMGGAMHGDSVVVRLEGRRGLGRTEARVVRVLKRGATRVVGHYEKVRRQGWVVPSDLRMLHDVFIPPSAAGDARKGQVVVAEITRYPDGTKGPEGRIVKVLGWGGEAGVDVETIIEEHQLPTLFPPDALAEAGRIPRQVPESALAGREDLRGMATVTIDGETARDFDDAVSVQSYTDGRIRLWVHIADVSHYVKEGSALDKEAYRRGTSVYFPDRAIPMLPEQLSNGICSLNPAEDRLTITCEMLFDREGVCHDHRFYPSVIRSDERMTYTDVAKILEQQDADLRERYNERVGDFEVMEELFHRLNRRRRERGSIDFDLPEPEIVLDLQGQPTAIIKSERNVAHRIIEECMLAANETVAGHMAKLETPFVYRVHEEPDSERIADFQEFSAHFGLRFQPGKKVTPAVFCDLLRQAEGRPEERLINQVLLRSMKQAVYSTENVGHFGLAAPFYTHFTSPIRRYPDLVVHRLLLGSLHKKPPAKIPENLAAALVETARHSSERERAAMEAEREVVSLKKARFMEDRVGESFDGFVSGVTAFGIFVELAEIFVEGLVHVSSLRDDYYRFEEKMHRLVGERTKKVFTIGDPVRVRVEKVDVERKRVDFGLALDV